MDSNAEKIESLDRAGQRRNMAVFFVAESKMENVGKDAVSATQ